MSGKKQPPPSLETVKSLPVDFRLMTENGELRNEVGESEDSPYSGKSERSRVVGDEQMDTSGRESRWSDTTSYATKKVIFH